MFHGPRLALRSLLRSKTYSAFTILTLSAAIGSSVAIVALMQAILWRELPLREPDRLVMVWIDNKAQGYPEDVTSYPSYRDLLNGNETLEDLAAYSYQTFHLTGDGEPERLRGASVCPSFFPMLGVDPILGSYLSSEEEFRFPDPRVVLSHGLWVRRFGGDRSIVGRTVRLDGNPYTVVGVMPPSFRIPEDHDFWVPLALEEEARTERHSFWLFTMGRLKPGVEPEEARADLEVLMAGIEREHFSSQGGMGIVVNRLHHQWTRELRDPLFLLGAGVASLWLIACTNLAAIALSRARNRSDEMALRRALGATRGRVARLYLVEALLIALIALPIGLLVASASLQGLQLFAPFETEPLDRIGTPALDAGAIVFAVLACLSSGLLISLAPVLHLPNAELASRLRTGGGLRGSIASRQRTGRLLIVAELALALVLLAGVLLLARSLQALQEVPIGLVAENRYRLNLTLPGENLDDVAVARLYKEIVESLETLPGVERAAVASGFLAGMLSNASTFTIEDVPVDPNYTEAAFIASVSPGYFETLGIPILSGRDFVATDTLESDRVVIINETMAERYWPGVDPVGRRMAYGTEHESEPRWRRVVGVVGDVRQLGLDQPVRPKTFLPLRQGPNRFMSVLIHSPLPPERLFPPVREAIWRVDARLPVPRLESVESILAERLSGRRNNTLVLGLFAGASLFLAALGVYGVTAFSVGQRRREIGVRMAFGARRTDVVLLVFREGLVLLGSGVIAGLLLALPLRPLVSGLLFGIGPFDPAALAGACLLLAAALVTACIVPAMRAARSHPADALRSD